MDLSPLVVLLQGTSGYRSLRRRLRSPGLAAGVLPLPRSARGLVTAALAQDHTAPVVLITARPDRELAFEDEIAAWSPGLSIFSFPGPNPLFYEAEPWGPRTIARRARVLSSLASSEVAPAVILTSVKGLVTRTLTPRQWAARSRTLRVGEREGYGALDDFLLGNGYRPDTLVVEMGQFSKRGGILDVWPPSSPLPSRIEFFGDEVESIRMFDPAQQRSLETLQQLTIGPAREGLPAFLNATMRAMLPEEPEQADARLEFLLPSMAEEPATLFDFLPQGSLILLDDRAAVESAVTEQEEQALEQARGLRTSGRLPRGFSLPYAPLDDLRDLLDAWGALDLGFLTSASHDPEPLASQFDPGPRFAGQLDRLTEHLLRGREALQVSVVVSRQADRLAEVWSHETGTGEVSESLPPSLEAGQVVFLRGSLTDGWSLTRKDSARIHVLSDSEIFGWGRPQPRMRPLPAAQSPESAYADLQPGDWVVHVDFGIGRYVDLVERTLEGVRREYLLIAYAEGGQVYVPIVQADRVTRYVGAEGETIVPSRLGTSEWTRAKSEARVAVEDVARDLLELYARRLQTRGHAFQLDTPWQHELEASFPYEETDDQRRAVEAVTADMERARPMDRLICGDAGYGKTEVALRAAFKAVMDGRQVALLVPTTVLAQQHYRTFRQRLAAFPAEVEMLSRFRTRAEAADILERLASGAIDIVIGTHRLLQHDVIFKDLGLLIIDEEQRFGVTHKEHFKKVRTEIDVLTLTATPIPRTLYMALTGARDISTINTPPDERLPVATHVGPYDPVLVRQAILRELDRGGQVFFVHNRVHTIRGMARRLEQLAPEARLAIAHGQMPEGELAQVMDRFTAGEVDVLVSTSIIESGLDIPNANTLIVDRADGFGLAQLYQLRGRVGRGAARGYAYLFRPGRTSASEEALQRLEILAENTQLGAGFNIAMQDMELRGAGEILGTRQHGHIVAIGFHLYTRLLAAAVRRMRSELGGPLPESEMLLQGREPLEVEIDLPVPTALPSDYIPDRALRLQLYRRLATLRDEEEVQGLRKELEDRFGTPPDEVDDLLYMLRIKILTGQAGADGISVENGQILIHLPGADERFGPRDVGRDVRRSKRGMWIPRREGWRDRLEELLRALARLA